MAAYFVFAYDNKAMVVCEGLIETKPLDANSKSLSDDTLFLLGSHQPRRDLSVLCPDSEHQYTPPQGL